MSDVKTRGEHQQFDAAELVGRFKNEEQQAKRVIFISPKAEQFLIQLRKQKKTVINGEVVEEEQIVARFQDHTFITDDDDTIRRVRKHKAYKAGKIVELGQLATAAKKKRVNDLVKQLQDPEIAAEVKAALEVGAAHVPTVKQKAKQAEA